MRRRRGFFLIEMLIVMTIGIALSGIAILMLYALMINHNTGREHLEYSRTVNRLAEQFRSDVHAMQKTSASGTDTEIDLMSEAANDAKVRYQCSDGQIDRSELQGEKTVRQESYVLGTDMEASIKTQEQGGATIVSIAILPKPQTDKFYHAFPSRIEAVLGRDLRLTKSMPKTATEGKP
jgi:type II secretory pathway pseudopilin PulG